ncbi:MAG: PilZ domain-containing protein [Desulfocapsaceae bacterium]|nr:PilZ domain-containing protein [Desulfocapsaceae bacterium]
MNNEKRAFDRVAFSVDRKIEVRLSAVHEQQVSVKARILNVSEGGIGLAFQKTENDVIEKNKEFFIDQVLGDDSLLCLQGQTVKIIWILNSDIFANLGVGCEFINISNSCVECIHTLRETEIEVSKADTSDH